MTVMAAPFLLASSCLSLYLSDLPTPRQAQGKRRRDGLLQNIFCAPPLKLKKRNGVIIFETKKKQGSPSTRLFRFPEALGHSTRLLRRSFGFCLALLEIYREVDGREERKVALPAGGGRSFFLRRSRG